MYSSEDRNYYQDRRVRAREERSWYEEIDIKKMTAIIAVPAGDYSEELILVPFKYEVCPLCDGKGTHANPSVDASGITAEDFYEDPDFAEEYLAGRYDVICYKCGGKNVVPVLHRDRIDPEILKKIDAQEEDREDFRRIQDAERRMGA